MDEKWEVTESLILSDVLITVSTVITDCQAVGDAVQSLVQQLHLLRECTLRPQPDE